MRRTAATGAIAAALAIGATTLADGATLAAGGASRAAALAPMCGTDEFDGTELDDARWDVLRPAATTVGVAGGKLNIDMANTDLITNTASATVVSQEAPTGGWTAVTKFNISAVNENGEQAGMVLWKSEGAGANTFAKATFIQVSSGEAGTRRFESIWTDAGAIAVPINPNSQTPPVTVAADADVMMRMRSDGLTVVAEYSLDDGANWTQIGQPARYAGPLRVGPLALRGSTGGGTIAFENFTLACAPEVTASTTHGVAPLTVDFTSTAPAGDDLAWDFGDGTSQTGGPAISHTFAEPGTYRVSLSPPGAIPTRGSTVVNVVASEGECPDTNDEFTGNALDPKWQILRPRLTGIGVAGGNLRLQSYSGDMSGGTASARNVLLQNAPTGPWTVETKIETAGLTATGDQAGLLVWRSEAPNHFAKVVYNRRSATTYWLERSNTRNGSTGFPGNDNGNSGERPVPAFSYLRISSDGATNPALQASWSEDGTNWTALRGAFSVEGSGPLKFGLTYFQGNAARIAPFDYFHVTGATGCDIPDTIAPVTTATLDPPNPGPSGSYDGPVEVTLNATDDDSGVEVTQYRVDGGPWTNYTDPAEQVLFDGTQDSLDDWLQAGPGGFDLQPDGSIQQNGGLGMLWYPGKAFGDFSLKFQFRDARGGTDFSNGGAFVRFPDLRNVPVDDRPNCGKTGSAQTAFEWVAIFCGQEIQVYDGTTGETQKTGSIYNFQPLDLAQARPTAKGAWNDYEIRVVGQQYTIVRNGVVINRFDNAIPKNSSRAGDPPTQDRQFATGYIGLQNHSGNDLLQYRSVRVSELGGAAAGPFTVSGDGQHTVEFRSRDVAGNLEATKSTDFTIGEPEPVNIFDTIGITESATRANSGIFGNPDNYSLPGEEMPPSRSIVTGGGPSDTLDDVPLRMPNTSGTVNNLAAFHGQTVILRPSEIKPYAKVHFFGTTTDGGPAGGDFVLRFSDGTTQTANVQFRDWCNAGDPTAAHHIAIGPLSRRWTENGEDGAPCGIYHVPITVTDPGKTLVSVKLPSTTTPGNPPIQGYLMALTLEQPSAGGFVMPDLGASPFPDDLQAPDATAALDPGTPQGTNGWYTSDVSVSLAATDAGGSGLDKIEYRVDGGAFQEYTAPFDVTDEGGHVVDYRAVDNAGNTSAPESADVKIDRLTPATTAQVAPENPGASGWYDDAVTVTLRGNDGASGSGIGVTQYRIGSGAWQTYGGPLVLDQVGTYSIAYRSTDVAGNAETEGPPKVVKVDNRAPTTSAQLTSAQPASGGAYRAPVQVALAADDGGGSGAAGTQYAVDGGAFQPYSGPFTVAALGGHLVEFRSLDSAGNRENTKDVVFVIAQPQASPPPVRPDAFVGLASVPDRLRVGALISDGLRVSATCVSVGTGTLKLTVSKAVARRLGLGRTTLASRSLRCGDSLRATGTLKLGRSVARKLRKARGTFRATLTVTMSGAGGKAADSEQLVLRGRKRGG